MSTAAKLNGGIGDVESIWPRRESPATMSTTLDPVEEAGDDSFPCSDPPSCTLGLKVAAHD